MAKSSIRKNFIWNMAGAGLNAFYSPLFLMIVSRGLGIREAGYFSLAFATGLLLQNIGLFNMRSYQITDVSRDHSDADYLNARIVTSALMILAVFLYSLTKVSSPYLFLVVLLQGLWRVPEAISDVMHGTLQMNRRLDLAGKSLFARGVLCIAVFLAAVWLRHDLVLACALAVAANILVFAVYDVRNYRKICPDHRFSFGRNVRALVRGCVPLFLISLIYTYLINAPRYAIDLSGTPEIQTTYALVVLPASMTPVIFLLVLNPLLPRLAGQYFSGRRSEFMKTIAALTASIAAFSLLYFVVMDTFGIRIFEIIYKVPLLTYRIEFLQAGIGSGLLCMATVFSNLLVLIREKKLLLLSHIAAGAAAAGLSIWLAAGDGVSGAVLSYLVTMSFFAAVLGVSFVFADAKKERERETVRQNGEIAA